MKGEDWSQQEIVASIAAYLDMLELELAGLAGVNYLVPVLPHEGMLPVGLLSFWLRLSLFLMFPPGEKRPAPPRAAAFLGDGFKLPPT